MKLDVVNKEGTKVSSLEVADSAFNVKMNEAVLHQVVKAHRANCRQGTHATKSRSMVSGGGKKPFRQKGTGNARQGSSRSPLMPGGGTAHGPQPRSYRQQLNRRVKELALKVALSDKIRHKNLIVVDDLGINTYSTKSVWAVLQSLKASKKALFTASQEGDFLYRSARNLHGVSTCAPLIVSATDVLRHDTMIISESALKSLEARLTEKKS